MATVPSDLYSYLSYTPKSALNKASSDHFFDKLGFKSPLASEHMRIDFIIDMEDHVQSSSHKFLTRAANPKAFKNVVSEFLAEYGPKYWGNSKRDHLEESDIGKGFLCPRDALRANSRHVSSVLFLMTLMSVVIRLVTVVESYFNHKAQIARQSDALKPRAHRLNRDINFAVLTGRKADLIQAIVSRTFERRQLKRPPRCLPESEEPPQLPQALDNDQVGTGPKKALLTLRYPRKTTSSASESTTLLSLAELGNSSKRARREFSPHRRAVSRDIETYESSHAPYPHPFTSNCNRSENFGPNPGIVIISDESDTGEKQQTKNLKIRTSKNTNISPGSPAPKEETRIKDEPLSSDITNRIKLRIKADGPGVSARGPIVVNFELYKTSGRLFTSLMSERNLKPERQKKVSQLTATVNGKETCCRRDRLDDWREVCSEVCMLWDKSPELFSDRFEVDTMLHVDE